MATERMRRAVALLALAAAWPMAAPADDTDIYMSTGTAAASAPLVMFTLDTSASAGAVYGGCAQVGTGAAMCAPAKYFRDHCPTCILPPATAPLTYFDLQRLALHMVLSQLTGIKAGLMLSHNHENNCAGPRPGGLLTAAQRCSNGAYVARGFKLLDQVTTPANPLLGTPASIGPGPNTAELLAILDSLPAPVGPTAHPWQGKEMFFELFRYLTGQGVYNGHNGYADYGTDDLLNLDVDRPAHDWDATIETAGRYVSPLTAGLSCTKMFTLNFVLNGSSQDSDSDAAIDSESAGGMVGLDLASPDNKLEQVLAYLFDVDLARSTSPFGTVPAMTGKQNVTSYFFTPPTPLNSHPPTFDRTVTEYARAGGSVRPMALTGDAAQVVRDLRGAMLQILSVSTTFVSGSVPVNVFSRTQVLNDVYLALFQPDAAARPFWTGNMKKLKARVVEVPCAAASPDCTATREVRLADALGQDAIQDDGRIRNDALTYWTRGSAIGADPERGIQAGRDGRHVDRGGAGQKIPGHAAASASGSPGMANAEANARQIYVYPGVGTALEPLDANAAASVKYQPALGAADAAESLRLIKWIRGWDMYDLDGDLVTAEARPWLMADPLHSRPLPINYGALDGYTRANPAIFVAVATNDGLLHFVRNTGTDGSEVGDEVWAFLPIDLLSIQKALALNAPLAKRLYGLDGSPTAYVLDRDQDGTIEAADGDKVHLYFGMRRGGRAYFALDVTDPYRPRFLWKAGPSLAVSAGTSAACAASIAAGTALAGSSPCANEIGGLLCSGAFCEMGYTFAQPRIGRVKNAAGAARPAVFIGGGYDALLNDYTAVTRTLYDLGGLSPGSINGADLIGNALYVVDAESGELIWKARGPTSLLASGSIAGATAFTHAGFVDSVPSTLTVVDTDSDGVTDRIVVGDTGGNVWRADLGGLPNDWKLTLLAKLGRHFQGGKLNDRRFFHEPDFVLSQDEHGPFDAILLGSGDREDPLDYGRERNALGTETLTENAFYVIKDRATAIGGASDADAGAVITPATLADVTANCLQGEASVACNPDLRNGWRIQLRQGRGEKVLASPLTAANRVYFTSYLPPRSNEVTTCGPSEGGGLFYAVGLKRGTAVFNFNTADGGSALAPNSAADRFESLASAGIPTEAVYINLPDATGAEVKCVLGSDLNCRALPGATRFRTFWEHVEE